ncbi:hypothetical protein B0H67DRAFT_557078 [Lasiosphaeris hirsuta]|uniref:Uncharacterized protein n=1 Tax=Lasiosphaeris hirsuta TaxID=260670 RepID=A0AA40A3L1_9PEZI|nr:hypothetical protein B0H67DRAFT_557078 [Lasiosphaeris hirsuta]
MSKVAACDGPHPSRSHLLLPTQMCAALRQILADYHSNTSKKLTIIVLTTGRWERDEGLEEVEELLAREIGNMANDPSFHRERRLTIEFVSFGEDEEGLRRLKNLDDDFGEKHGIPDVIDTEPWQGDPDKMLLGSIHALMDKQVTPPADHYRMGGASGHLTEPASPVHYRAPSPGSGPRNSTFSLPRSDTGTRKPGSRSGFRRVFG